MFNKNKIKNIYLDNASGTEMSKRVRRVILKSFDMQYGNPDAIHQRGVLAKKRIEEARGVIASCIGAHPDEIIFTSGGTESDNLAILGALRKAKSEGRGNHVMISAVEHGAVYSLIDVLKKEGFDVDIIPVDETGELSLSFIKENLKPETILVSVMMANNETGILYGIKDIAKIIRQFKKTNQKSESKYPLLHTDAIQAFQTEEIKVDSLGVDLLTLSSQKIYGPLGIGMLYVKRGTPVLPIIFGGGQERGLRSGTLPTSLILGMEEAFRETSELRAKEKARLKNLREFFVENLKENFDGIGIIGEGLPHVPQIVSVKFKNVASESLLLYLDQAGIFVSSKSACDSSTDKKSHVLEALKVGDGVGVIRFSFGRDTKKSDLVYVIKKIKKILPLITS
jgi:cysteine desulfurase